jgi:hypothetical protein
LGIRWPEEVEEESELSGDGEESDGDDDDGGEASPLAEASFLVSSEGLDAPVKLQHRHWDVFY